MSALLSTISIEKPWGRDALPEPFVAPEGQRIGEIWFRPPAELDALLVKYIFTSEKLSVQVHPSDAQTIAAGLGRQGKEECWLIVDAEPGAVLGIGFNSGISSDAIRAAALDGGIENLLSWHPAEAGDFFYVPANTVHAIGAGISLIEVQQNSDITYRLYDYGRPRALHLDEGVAIASGAPYDTVWKSHVPADQPMAIVDGPLFRFDQLTGAADAALIAHYGERPLLVLPRTGSVQVGDISVAVGQCALASTLRDVVVPPGSACLIAQPKPA